MEKRSGPAEHSTEWCSIRSSSEGHGLSLHYKQGYLKNHPFLKITSQLDKSIQAWATGGRLTHKEMVQNRRHLERSSLCLAGKLYKLYLRSTLGKLSRSKDCRIWIQSFVPCDSILTH